MSSTPDEDRMVDLERAGLDDRRHRDCLATHAADRVLDHLERTREEDNPDLAKMRARLAETRLPRRRRAWRSAGMPMVPAVGATCALLSTLGLAWLPGEERSPEPVAVASQVPAEVLANIDFYEWLARRQRIEQAARPGLPVQHAGHDRR